MADSIILFPSKSHIANKAGTVVTFNATNKTLVSSNTGTIAFTDFVDGDIVVVTGSVSNNATFTVSGSPTATTLTVLETVTTEAAGASVTVDHQGAYSGKQKADGYYGYTDGLHTSAFHLNAYIGVVKMQASLASTPTKDDWFDVDATSATYASAETSNKGYNYTGNFVWVRAALTGMTAGSVTKVLYNY
jgi:hypothetical protein